MTGSLRRRAAAEALGTAALVAVVVGSGIQAAELSQDVGVRLLANSLATVLGLGVLIALFGPVSGAHFNPVVTLASWFVNRPPLKEVGAYIGAQTAGAISGAVVANAMFAEPLVAWSTHHRDASNLLVGEVVATAGLVALIFGLLRSGKENLVPMAVAAFIGSAYWFTSSTSFANPAVTIGRAFTDTFAGIAPSSVAPFIAAQVLGGVVGLVLVAVVLSSPAPSRSKEPTP